MQLNVRKQFRVFYRIVIVAYQLDGSTFLGLQHEAVDVIAQWLTGYTTSKVRELLLYRPRRWCCPVAALEVQHPLIDLSTLLVGEVIWLDVLRDDIRQLASLDHLADQTSLYVSHL